MVEREHTPEWSYGLWRAASIGWAAFIGAVLAVLALLMGWEALLVAGDRPGWGFLAGCFAIAWLIALVPAIVAWSLTGRPK